MTNLLTPTLELPLPKAQLRPWRPTDAPALARHANDRSVWQNLRDTFPHPYTAEDAAYYLAMVADSSRDLHLAFEVQGEAVGSIGVHFKSDVRRRSAEIGYWLARPYWGRGLATAAVQAVSEYVFAHFDVCRLYAVVFESNVASGRVLEKAGYELEAILRKSVVKDGRMLDSRLYALVV
ncbi:GNAT family N-acetyltransferase [Hymenobacter psychrotolerans]|uniref:Protein N-acetyltransferase, RimJ/RimL family n=1 Tax=Hymenobacter psychrotolerans DSM 18569 TaxID=1121959 RepID=A0A1M6Q088_9BACT|nr:GNAT family N-acetyltransferase [Hymenobacter psychrotolerans]SHK13557.1 Protein N-acetyltransferase, RimJ/RimL family [Hymenobacter psychrotolerans DSM 18569]